MSCELVWTPTVSQSPLLWPLALPFAPCHGDRKCSTVIWPQGMGSENGESVWPLERAGTPSIVKGGESCCWRVGLLEGGRHGMEGLRIELLVSEVEAESRPPHLGTQSNPWWSVRDPVLCCVSGLTNHLGIRIQEVWSEMEYFATLTGSQTTLVQQLPCE